MDSNGASADTQLTIPNTLDYLPVALAFAEAAARVIGFDDERCMQVRMAVEEGVSGIVQHAYKPGVRDTVRIICSRTSLGMEIRLYDKGLPFDAARMVEYRPQADLKEQDGHGLGLYLMRAMMDEVSFVNLGRQGHEIRLHKYLPHQNITEVAQAELTPYAKQPKPERIVTTFTIRRMRADEAIDVARCMYRGYGYSYMSDHVYYPERLVQMNRDDSLYTAVAVAEDGNIAGTCALIFTKEEANVAEIGQAVVKPEYRGNKALELLTDHLVAEARQRGLHGVFAQAVTNHPYSQKSMHRLGYRDSALLLGYCPASMDFKNISDGLAQRESIILASIMLAAETRVLYLPARHAAILRETYQSLELPVEWKEAGDRIEHTRAHGHVHAGAHKQAGNGTITVRQSGADIIDLVQYHLRRLCLRHVETIFLYLSLRDPLTAALLPEYETMGFFYAGILPGTSGGDTLVLQYMNNVAFNLGKLRLDSPFAERLAEYVGQAGPRYVFIQK